MRIRDIQHPPWWYTFRYELLKIADKNSPCYVYSKSCLHEKAVSLLSCQAVDRVFYSVKANSNKNILQQFYQEGIGFECVSLSEVYFILKLFPDILKNKILFTPNFAPKKEYHQALALDILITIDNLYILEHWAELFFQKNIFIRVDLGEGHGHHKYVVTGGDESKFGIPISSLAQVSEIVNRHDIRVVGLHSHAGSGILNPLHWEKVFRSLTNCLQLFPHVTILDVGGGLGITERQDQTPLSLDKFNQSLVEVKKEWPKLQIWIEPGRYLVAESGVLLAKVTQTKVKGSIKFVGIETGMNSFLRPMLYDSYHEIVNLTRLDEPIVEPMNIVGPICESGDTLGRLQPMPICQEDDVILIENVGAYGYSMSSNYNLREPAQEYYAAEC
ncbi:MAG: diaminopimelate decarboxylase [Gammaproteobacteria bacterium RIFCSPHIGHO2_12_FULL_41_15]|nr:MAG: diaminopimelate decarboxylase [Gammaproteobacteria bacterium RIFCSPHIGHO2_12_FULL_41_15]